MEDSLQRRILHALFSLSRDTRHISAATLADAVGTTPTRAASALIALERAGLCDASRARLTMLGLATASRIRGQRGGPVRRRKSRAVQVNQLVQPAPVQLPVRRDQPEPLAADGPRYGGALHA